MEMIFLSAFNYLFFEPFHINSYQFEIIERYIIMMKLKFDGKKFEKVFGVCKEMNSR